MRKQTERPPRNVLPELIIPALALAFAIYYLTTITEVPWIAQASAMLVSALLVLSIIAFGVRTAYRIKAGREYLGFSDALGGLRANSGVNTKRAILFVLTMLYVFLMPRLGFSIATFLLIFLSIIVLSERKITSFARAFFVALICTVVGLSLIHI